MFICRERRKPRVVILTALVAYHVVNPYEFKEEFEGELEGAWWNSFGGLHGYPPLGEGRAGEKAVFWKGPLPVLLQGSRHRASQQPTAKSALEVKMTIFAWEDALNRETMEDSVVLEVNSNGIRKEHQYSKALGNFSFDNKPFCGHLWFWAAHLSVWPQQFSKILFRWILSHWALKWWWRWWKHFPEGVWKDGETEMK